MRKIFTLIAVALMSVGMSAEQVYFRVAASALPDENSLPETIYAYGSWGSASLPLLGITYNAVDDLDAGVLPQANGDDTFNFSYLDGDGNKKVLATLDGKEASFKFSDYWTDAYGVKMVSIENYYSNDWDVENYKWIDYTETPSGVTTVTVTAAEIAAGAPGPLTKDGITITANEWYNNGTLYGGGTFSSTIGDFTKIEVTCEAASSDQGEGWSGATEEQKTWAGTPSSTVTFAKTFYFMGVGQIVFTIGSEDTAVKNITDSKKATATKRIVNGKLVIERNGKFYNATGVEVK